MMSLLFHFQWNYFVMVTNSEVFSVKRFVVYIGSLNPAHNFTPLSFHVEKA